MPAPAQASRPLNGEAPRRAHLRIGFEIALGLLGLIVSALSFAADRDLILRGLNDFPAFYLAPRMLAHGDLYHPAALLAEQARVLGHVCTNIQFIRLPYLALALAPLSQLPYQAAYILWQALSAAALAAFIRLWPAKRSLAVVMCCWFPPVAANFANAQDVTFLLLWAGLAVLLMRGGRDFAAGLVLALCAQKFHLLVFLPVLIAATRKWRLGAGLAAGSALLLALSFAAAGVTWPAEFVNAIRNPEVHPGIARTSLAALVSASLEGLAKWAALAALALAAGAAVYRTAARGSFALGLAAALAAGPFVGFHVYVQDYLLALPLILMLFGKRYDGNWLTSSGKAL